MAEVPEQSSSCRFARRRSERPRTRRSCITAAQKLTPNQTPSRLEDPHEYVRRGYDLLEDLQSPRTAAVNLLIDVVEKVSEGAKGKKKSRDASTYLPKVLAHVESVLSEYDKARASANAIAAADPRGAQAMLAPLARRKDGALIAIGSLNESLKQSDKYANALEPLLVAHVGPEFTSPFGHLRAKACWVASKFADTLDVENGNTFGALLQGVFGCLHDPDLPVRVDALVCLRHFVEAIEGENEELLMQKYVLPHLPTILNDFFQLIFEVDNDDLVQTLEAVVEKSGTAMAPYAVQVMKHLATSFWRSMSTAGESGGIFVGAEASVDDVDEGDADVGEEGFGSLVAAAGCMRAMSTVLESVSSLPDLYGQVHDDIVPLLHKYISAEGSRLDIMEETLDVLAYFTYYAPAEAPLGDAIWKCCDLMLGCLEARKDDGYDGWAFCFLDNLLIPLDNFISRDVRRFCESGLTARLLVVVRHLLQCGKQEYGMTESDLWCCPKILSVLLQYAKKPPVPGAKEVPELGTGAVGLLTEEMYGAILGMVLDRMRVTTQKRMSELLMVVWWDALHYDARACIRAMAAYGSARRLAAGQIVAETVGFFVSAVESGRTAGGNAADDGDEDVDDDEEEMRRFRRPSDAKACIVGALDLLAFALAAAGGGAASIDAEAAAAVDGRALTSAVLQLLEQLRQREEAEDEEEEEEDEDEGEEEEDEDDEFDEDEEEEGFSVKRLAQRAAAAYAASPTLG